MATTIKLKNGSGAPLAGDLVQGEPALDLTNKRLYTENSGGTVIEIGTNPTSLTTGTFTSTGIDDNATSTALTVTDSGIAATLTTAAQPNITSVGTLTNFTSTGIDDNATSTAITIDSSERTFFNSATNRPVSVVSTDTNAFVSFEDANSASVGHVKIGSETDDMVFYANAQERMRIKSNSVGIGTTSPAEVLHVANTGTAGAVGLRAENSEGHVNFTTNGGGFQFETGASGAVATIDSIGRVGIGTTAPSTYSNASELVVDTGLAGGITVVSDSTSGGYGGLYFADGTTGDEQYRGFFQYNHNNSGTDEMLIGTAGATRVTIDSDGYTGIGTDDPQMRLHVHENNSAITTDVARFSNSQMSASFNAGAKISIGDDTLASRQLELSLEGNGSSEFYAYVRTTEAGGPLFLGTATVAEAVTVASNGNVGIGTTSPVSTAKLSISDASNAAISIDNTSGRAYELISTSTGLFGLLDRDAAAYRMLVDSSGNLLVGRNSGIGNERLAVKSTALTCTFYSANSTANGTLMSYYSDVGGTEQQVAAMQRDGDIANTNNSYGALSDERLKSNIVDASSQIDDIMAVQVRSYTLDSTGDTHIGVVAQELEASGMSGLVKENEDGMKSVKYSVLYMKAIKALQEAVTRIETLEAEVAALKGA